MLDKKIMLIYCLLETGGGGGGGRNENCLRNAKNELVLYGNFEKIELIFEDLETIGGEGGGNLRIVSRRQKMSIIFLSSIPKEGLGLFVIRLLVACNWEAQCS